MNAPTLTEALRMCPFRTLLGARGSTAEELGARIGCALVLLGGDPEPLSADMIAEAVDALAAGQTVLLAADRGDLRDRAKREILALLGPVEGRA